MSTVNLAMNNPCCTTDCAVQSSNYFYAVPVVLAPVVLSILGLTGVLSLPTMAIANISVVGCSFAAISLACCKLDNRKDASKTVGISFVATISILAMNILGLLRIVPFSYVPIATIGAAGFLQLSAYGIVYCLGGLEVQSRKEDTPDPWKSIPVPVRNAKPRLEAMPNVDANDGKPWEQDRKYD